MENKIFAIILFSVGFYEAILAMSYYRAGRVEHKKLCACLEMIRSTTYIFITGSIVINKDNILIVGIPYVIGTGVGNYYSWYLQPIIDKIINKGKKKRGRRKKYWWLWSYRNK